MFIPERTKGPKILEYLNMLTRFQIKNNKKHMRLLKSSTKMIVPTSFKYNLYVTGLGAVVHCH